MTVDAMSAEPDASADSRIAKLGGRCSTEIE
jgi:hypothetical protein